MQTPNLINRRPANAGVSFTWFLAAIVAISLGGCITIPPSLGGSCQVDQFKAELRQSDVWDGPCVDGYAHGHGTLRSVLKDGAQHTYVGDMARGRFHGRGSHTSTTSNGFPIVGEFVNGSFERGTFYEKDGSMVVYETRRLAIWYEKTGAVRGYLVNNKRVSEAEYLAAKNPAVAVQARPPAPVPVGRGQDDPKVSGRGAKP